MRRLRAFLVLAAFFAFTLPLMPLQLLLRRTGSRFARTFPHWYHRQVCRIVGVRLRVEGRVAREGGVLLVSNHVSWLDIVVLSAVAPVSFVAKQEVASWPFVSWLAQLQRSVFIDRNRRTEVTGKANEILQRLDAGDHIVLFAEGTSSDGNTVLPFKTALFAAVKPQGEAATHRNVCVQTLAITYTKLYGLPLCRRGRHFVAWYGDMDLASHAWRLLGKGPLDAEIRIGPPVPLDQFADRKALALYAEEKVRNDVTSLLRGRWTGTAR
ncbi:MAG: lysophospholipid acyltransferase family protein [Methyloceanibacter sp.]|uniref:lysophospholipid acyltransferase family protein n=1 Tax=Methyloceanibacter sp. TaxID=1965321 RepID=UPI003D9B796C